MRRIRRGRFGARRTGPAQRRHTQAIPCQRACRPQCRGAPAQSALSRRGRPSSGLGSATCHIRAQCQTRTRSVSYGTAAPSIMHTKTPDSFPHVPAGRVDPYTRSPVCTHVHEGTCIYLAPSIMAGGQPMTQRPSISACARTLSESDSDPRNTSGGEPNALLSRLCMLLADASARRLPKALPIPGWRGS